MVRCSARASSWRRNPAAVWQTALDPTRLAAPERGDIRASPSIWVGELVGKPAPRATEAQRDPGELERAPPLFSDCVDIGNAVAERIRAAGGVPILVSLGEHFECTARDHYYLDPRSIDHVRRLFDEVFDASSRACRGIVHLGSLKGPNSSGSSADADLEGQMTGLRSALSVIQTAAGIRWAEAPRDLARHAGAVLASRPAMAVAQAPLWGLGRVFGVEHPELLGGLVDLGPAPAHSGRRPALGRGYCGLTPKARSPIEMANGMWLASSLVRRTWRRVAPSSGGQMLPT